MQMEARPTLTENNTSRYLDGLTVVFATVSTVAFVLCEHGYRPNHGLLQFVLNHREQLWMILALVSLFVFTLIFNLDRLHLYASERIHSILREQRLILHACATTGFLVAGTLYMLHPKDMRTEAVAMAVGSTTAALCAERFVVRILRYRSFVRGIGARNALIVGTGATALALRHHLDNIHQLGYSFKGYIAIPGLQSNEPPDSAEIVGTLSTIFDVVRRQFVDEILFVGPCPREAVRSVLEQANEHNVSIRFVPDLFDLSPLNPSVDYLGHFPAICLRSRRARTKGLLLKRTLDILFSSLALLLLFPWFIAIAILIRCDSPGPILYVSERIGRKGLAFPCFKFRSMVQDAERQRAKLHEKNQRDGILFKIDKDPRITRVGYYLRKYSLDELPQLWSVLVGDMSLVGPRPPIASEVKQYELSHLRRLDVTPGITGLWQVEARRDPSFDRYISLDMTYIENWSNWLDLQIIVRTIGVVLAGTGA